METIGVTSIDPWFVLDDDSLLKSLYYFDKLVYRLDHKDALEKFCNSLPNGKNKFKKKIEEIEKLELAGLISVYEDSTFNIDKLKHLNEWIIKYDQKALDLSLKFSTKDKTFEDTFFDFLERFREVAQLHARSDSIVLNKRGQNLYTPIIKGKYYNFSDNELFASSTVLSVIFKKFPIVTDDFGFEKLIEFKGDPDTRLKLSRLKEWVLEISKKNYTEKEIEQKIDYLVQEYAKQLDFHKLKYTLGSIESIVTITLEVLENLVKLNFSKAAKVLFDLKRQELALLEAEQKMIGRELAFIHQLNDINSR